MELVSVSAHAKEIGVSRQAVSKQLKKLTDAGLLEVTRRGNGVFFDPKKYTAAKAEIADPARALGGKVENDPPGPNGVRSSDAPGGFQSARTLRESANASMAELALQERLGALVRRDEVEAAAFKEARAVRDAVLGTCKRIAEPLATMKGVREIKAFLTKNFETALMQVASNDSPTVPSTGSGGDGKRRGGSPGGIQAGAST